MLCHVEGSETCLRLYACMLVMLVLYEFHILTQYFECMFIVRVCVFGGGGWLPIFYVIE